LHCRSSAHRRKTPRLIRLCDLLFPDFLAVVLMAVFRNKAVC
jgi:hypothetical protein